MLKDLLLGIGLHDYECWLGKSKIHCIVYQEAQARPLSPGVQACSKVELFFLRETPVSFLKPFNWLNQANQII